MKKIIGNLHSVPLSVIFRALYLVFCVYAQKYHGSPIVLKIGDAPLLKTESNAVRIGIIVSFKRDTKNLRKDAPG